MRVGVTLLPLRLCIVRATNDYTHTDLVGWLFVSKLLAASAVAFAQARLCIRDASPRILSYPEHLHH